MKKIFWLITATLTISGCDQSSTSGNTNIQQNQEQLKTDPVKVTLVNQSPGSTDPLSFFTLSNAEKILGEPAHLSDSTLKTEGDDSKYSLAYTANSKDLKTGKTGNVYLMLEKYAQESSAKKVYSSIKTSNENHEGVQVLNDLGDEAYFHSDGKNFFFILARKSGKMLRMKVNKITGTTSLDEFNRFAENVVAAL